MKDLHSKKGLFLRKGLNTLKSVMNELSTAFLKMFTTC